MWVLSCPLPVSGVQYCLLCVWHLSSSKSVPFFHRKLSPFNFFFINNWIINKCCCFQLYLLCKYIIDVYYNNSAASPFNLNSKNLKQNWQLEFWREMGGEKQLLCISTLRPTSTRKDSQLTITQITRPTQWKLKKKYQNGFIFGRWLCGQEWQIAKEVQPYCVHGLWEWLGK